MKSYFCADTKCPFYKGDNGHTAVSCEGILGATCIKISFDSNKPKPQKGILKRHIYKFCADEFESCPLYQMIMRENYPEEKNEDGF